MRILFLSPRQCWPPRSGAKLREYHLLRALTREFEVTYLYFIETGSTSATRSEFPFCREVAPVPKPDSYTPLQTHQGGGNSPLRLLQGLLGRWPFPVLNYRSPEMAAAVARALGSGSFDFLFLDSIHMIRYAEGVPDARVVIDWHNIESEAMQRYSETVESAPKRFYASQTAQKFEDLERVVLRDAFGHIVCSQREKDHLVAMAPSARIAVVENGVDTAYFADARNGAHRKVVFVGAMEYSPNADAAVFFATRIWPAIREKIPNLELAIVGAGPPARVEALAALPGITVTGTVPDVRPYYGDALAAVVPLRTGGGTRLKILEAMAAGVPVISTPLGAEGLAVTPGANILLADAEDPDQWVRHLVSLPAPRLVGAARELVATRYDWEMLGRGLTAWLREAA